MEEIGITILLLILCWWIVGKLFPDKNKIKVLPHPPTMKYEDWLDFREMLWRHDLGEAADHIYKSFNEVIIDLEKVKEGIGVGLERQRKEADNRMVWEVEELWRGRG